MVATTDRRDLPASTRTVLVGLLVAALAVLAILPVRRGEDAGFALVVGPLLLISAGLVWRFGRLAHLWAAVLGFLLLLMFAAYTVADLTRGIDDVGVFLLDVTVASAGAVTAGGAVRYLLTHRRRSGR